MIDCDQYHEVNYSITSTASGYSEDFFISSSTGSTIRADIPFEYIYHVKIWGQLKSSKGFPLSGLMVRLLQINLFDLPLACLKIGETLTDANGFYLFDLPNQSCACYQLIIHSNNPLNNKVLSPNLNPCKASGDLPTSCYQSLMDYLDHHFPNTYSQHHFMKDTQATPLVATVYAIPCYR